MATVTGVNYTKITTTPVDHILPRDAHGRVRVQYDTYEAAALADPSTIQLFKMPADARVIDFKVWHDALGSGTTLAFGDVADPDRRARRRLLARRVSRSCATSPEPQRATPAPNPAARR